MLKKQIETIQNRVHEIQDRIARKEIMAPAQISEIHINLVSYFAYANEQYALLEIAKNRFHEKFRENHKSDKATESSFLSTEEGECYIKLKYLKRSLDRLQSSFKLLREDAKKEMINGL